MPVIKLSRLRKNFWVRELISQAQLSARGLIAPYFVMEGRNVREPIESMPGIQRLSVDNLLEDIKEARRLGIRAALLFGIAQRKDQMGSAAYSKAGAVQKAVKAIKNEIKDIVVITDVCLCGHTLHGHCGIIKRENSRRRFRGYAIDNEETLKALAKVALSHAQAGADFVAPSAMMDGQVKMIRAALDRNGFDNVGILAYSAKYASSFYGPFRDALGSAPQFGDRKAYQMDYRNSDEAIREIAQDIEEGADMVMVKPALAYLDIVFRAKREFAIPIVAYNVSGEYSLVKIGSTKRLFNEKDMTLEILTSLKRAGADLIITYHAKEVARWLRP